MADRFDQRLVGFGQVDVFADHADRDFFFRMVDGINELAPDRQVGFRRRQFQLVADDGIQSLIVQHLRDLVDGIDIPDRDNGVFPNI